MKFCKDQGSGAKVLAEFIDDVATFRVRIKRYSYCDQFVSCFLVFSFALISIFCFYYGTDILFISYDGCRNTCRLASLILVRL